MWKKIRSVDFFLFLVCVCVCVCARPGVLFYFSRKTFSSFVLFIARWRTMRVNSSRTFLLAVLPLTNAWSVLSRPAIRIRINARRSYSGTTSASNAAGNYAKNKDFIITSEKNEKIQLFRVFSILVFHYGVTIFIIILLIVFTYRVYWTQHIHEKNQT